MMTRSYRSETCRVQVQRKSGMHARTSSSSKPSLS
jgi:hypothetical protein